MMNRYSLALICALLSPGVFAQIRVELAFEQETYLPQEPLNAVVRIYNSSGQTLKMGKTRDWLSFTVEAEDGSIVRQIKAVDVVGEFSLPSSSRAKKLVNLAVPFELTRFGRYRVMATVRVPEWNQTFGNPSPRHFTISPGVKLWESNFGIPPEKPGQPPEVRKYLLVQANRANRNPDASSPKELTLFARVTDPSEAETFALIPLGPLVGFSHPEPQVDRWSNLHILYQVGARDFLYHVVTPDGLILTRQTWDIVDDSRPGMTVNAEGRIEVKGGSRRISGTDLPPPDLLSEKSSPPGDLLDAAAPAEKPANAEKSKKKK
ncbi:MAG TPA: hypothetical protein VGR78_05285 [Verrucomicrobiae bacterium]|jgi:hypothetical protein|nr:hypothetical protein [Verrucomicrobiae bacterium]